MKLFRTEFDVVEISSTAMQGWYNRGRLSEAADAGWTAVNCTATGPQGLLVLMQRRVWFWQDQPKPSGKSHPNDASGFTRYSAQSKEEVRPR